MGGGTSLVRGRMEGGREPYNRVGGNSNQGTLVYCFIVRKRRV